MSEKRIIVAFRNDDPSALSDLDHEREIFGLFESRGIPQTIGVIPAPSLTAVHDKRGAGEKTLLESPGHATFLRDYAERTGSELALHGYTHRTNRFSIPARQEYFEFKELSLAEQERMIAAGTEILEKALGVRPVTFIPPWNRLDENTVLACARNGYKFISAAAHFPAVGGMLCFGSNASLESFDEAFAAAVKAKCRVFINVLFHSRTIRTKQEMAQLERVLELVGSHPECSILTVAQAAAQFPEELKLANEAACNIVPLYAGQGTVRARSWGYYKTFQRIVKENRLRKCLEAARELYWSGRYEECLKLSSSIERECSKMIWLGRLIGLGSGCVIGALAAVLTTTNFGASLPIRGLASLGVLLVGGLQVWRATTKSSRRELVLATFLSVLGSSWVGNPHVDLGKLLGF